MAKHAHGLLTVILAFLLVSHLSALGAEADTGNIWCSPIILKPGDHRAQNIKVVTNEIIHKTLPKKGPYKCSYAVKGSRRTDAETATL
ncbi:hypothetical protein O6H91_16G016500 [Diphasiastrum complanatum]|uniref:Uncharacterized protein n=1 Tax=Diphasiastrum complanatum TaxID=34168 RepID=A0ACC2BA88_DIPCM|nr:hypothetical protein O6H91_16G016500 [Diphasiastrum complanatum]